MMKGILKSLVHARQVNAVVALIAAASLSQTLLAAEQEINFRGQKIKYEGARLKWIGSPAAKDAELLLIYTNVDASAVQTFTPPLNMEARVLMVGGGGAGGTVRSASQTSHPGGGGGGAGEVVDRLSVSFLGEKKYVIGVGAGGVADGVSGTASVGRNGGESFITVDGGDWIRVKGGGGGGGESVGVSGGSGGGGSNTDAAGGAGVANEADGHVNAGGVSLKRYAAGGGGAGTAGGDAIDGAGGDGGAGIESDIVPDDVKFYGGGGGGGTTMANRDGGLGGAGGGGAGGGAADADAANPTAGEDGLGGGGGGGGRYRVGARGGHGIVIIRLTYIEVPMQWKSVSVEVRGSRGEIRKGEIQIDTEAKAEWVDGDLVITYTEDRGGLRVGTDAVPVWAKARVLMVGGGGGGGFIDVQSRGGGAGGGAGGVVTNTTDLVFDSNVEFAVAVGRGGKGGEKNEETGARGTDSSLRTNGVDVVEVAAGGGGGGAHSAGLDGGSGGGGSRATTTDAAGSYDRAGGIGRQGHDGGNGAGTFRGAGGGGAGGAGGDAGSTTSGAGGAGIELDITGRPVWYAAGGGGAYVNVNNATGSKGPGGAGGSGIGGDGAGCETGTALRPIPAGDGLDGTGSGGGGGTTHATGTSSAGRGGHGIVVIRLSGFVVSSVTVPDPQGPFIYDGSEKEGVAPSYAYVRGGQWKMVNSDIYTATVTLQPGSPYGWDDGQPGATREIVWKIFPHGVDIPVAQDRGFVFSATGITPDNKNAYPMADELGRCWIVLEPGCTNVHYCTLTGHIHYDAGDHEFNAKLANYTDITPNVTNFVWNAPEPLVDKQVSWHIDQAANEITSVSIPDWQEGTTNATPTSNWRWKAIAADYATTGIVDQVKYQWKNIEDGAWVQEEPMLWEELIPPATAGVYVLRAYICEDSNHTPGNWVAADAETRFCVWRHPSKTLCDYVDISGLGSGTTPVKISIREPVRSTTGAITGGIPGFHYADVRRNGLELRFVAIDDKTDVADCDKDNPLAADTLLPFRVDVWSPSGISTISVKRGNTNTSSVRMYWRAIDGADVPEDLLPLTSASGTVASPAFGLVNQRQDDGSRAWVNYWTKEPTVSPRYVELGKAPSVNSGTMKSMGNIERTYHKMPEKLVVDSLYPTTNAGAYTITFSLRELAEGTAAYPGPHVYYDGDRTLDFDVFSNRPSPIDPSGSAEGVNMRVLLGNDDRGVADRPLSAVSGQSYLAWEHLDHYLPQTVVTNYLKTGVECLTNNLLPGAEHVLTNSLGQTLWRLSSVFLGNMMSADPTAETFLLTNQHSLPWSATSLNSSTNEAAYAEALDRRWVGQLIMRNEAGTADDVTDNAPGATILSPWYTNGVGTVYFDAVNAYVTNLTATTTVTPAFRLAVEVSTNAFDDMTLSQRSNVVWQSVKNLQLLKYSSGTAFASSTKANVVTLDIKNLSAAQEKGTNQFYRVIAQMPADIARRPLRFRIRRITSLNGADADDWHGFIVIDNVIASWPTADVRLQTYGWFDGRKSGRQVLGWENAFTVDYPSAFDTNVYIHARFDGDPSIALSARCYYRWRYLDAMFDPERVQESGVFQDKYETVYLDPANGFRAIDPLPLNGVPGDIEYYFDLTAIVPFYQYVDYSGLGLNDPTKGYTEEPEKGVTSRREEKTRLPSRGTDWFVRLREGVSGFESFTGVFTVQGGFETNTIDMMMSESHVWRGFFRTPSDMAGKKLRYRFESKEPKAPGVTPDLLTRRWVAGSNLSTPDMIPGSPILGERFADDWAEVYVDAATGHLMFQLDDRTMSLTVTHADYQDFNGWSDAVGHDNPPYFIGSDIASERASGVSSKMKRMSHSFDGWADTPDTKKEWHEEFSGELDVGYIGYEPFAFAYTPNGWSANNAMWAARFYHPTDLDSRAQSGLALELIGAQNGNLQLVSPAESPRGIGTLKFTARVAQPIDFALFNYSDAEPPAKLNNYTFMTRATFDLNGNKNFAGNASLSLVAFYNENRHLGPGCYEARWEQLKGDWDQNTETFKNGPNLKNQRLALYRWAKDEFGEIVPTLLGAITNVWFKIPQTSTEGGNYMPFFISASTDASGNARVSAGVLRKDGGLAPSAELAGNWVCVNYIDNSPNHPKAGTYGVLSANCEGVFIQPTLYNGGRATISGEAKDTDLNKFMRLDNKTVTFGGEPMECKQDLADFYWQVDGTRMIDYISSGNPYVWGLKAQTPSTKLNLFFGTRGKDDWKLYNTTVVKGFGTNLKAGDTTEIVVRTVEDHSFQLAAAPSEFSDVVLTDVQFSQWRGDTFGDDPGDTKTFPDYHTDDRGMGFRSNFVFTAGIVVTNTSYRGHHKLRLSAKRTPTDYPCSIRSPLMDGYQNLDGRTYRGLGLGMISFSYENAQANARVLVQIATNQHDVVGHDITAITRSVDTNIWTTVDVVDFSKFSASERLNGVYTTHIGLHGVQGLMRIVLDPALVASVQANNVTDTSKFGEIDITKILVRDEPKLDSGDWWGWNVRTVAGVANSVSDYKRTYLPDGDFDPEASGMPIALNNSITADVRAEDREDVRHNLPFVQTPTFTNNLVGEVSFRARRFDNGESSQYAEVLVYGATAQDATEWKLLTAETVDDELRVKPIIVSNTTYEAFSFRAAGTYKAFRLVVADVDGVDDGQPHRKGKERKYYPPVRVLIDELAVYEAVNPSMGFCYVYPFRDGMEETTACTNVVDAENNPLPDAQPLNGESWTVQAKIEKRQLPDEIDTTTRRPRVFFHWYQGVLPWGYNNWRDRSEANTAELALADDADENNLIFRGSVPKARNAVVGAVSSKTPTVVQYTADIVYYTLSGTELTNSLVVNASTSWKRPEWYAPVDYNTQYASQGAAAAYTIIDTIAPHRVWINEVNIWDGRDSNFNQLARTNQFVEIAAPELQSLDGWRLDYINYDKKTNTLCWFSDSIKSPGYVPGTKDLKKIPSALLNEYRTNDYVFIGVQSPKTKDSKVWNNVPCAIDGTWNDFDGFGGILDGQNPIGLRLVRPSKIVEQEIALEGTNIYATGRYAGRNSVTNWIAQIERTMPGGKSHFYPVGNEYDNAPNQSLGVIRGYGGVSNDWTNVMVKTPGRVNEGQILPDGFVLYPNGELMIVHARIGANGRILQAQDGEKLSANEIVMMFKKGGEGTNITYQVADWWEMDTITTNGQAMAGVTGRRGQFSVNIGAGQSNDVTVVATARPYEELSSRYGLTPDNPYTPAVMSWLEGGKNYFGEPFRNPGEIYLADFRTAVRYEFVTNLDLTTMYWLDMDPTESNWVLRAGLTGLQLKPGTSASGKSLTHFRLDRFHMEITNEASHVAYSPYVLRGLAPGETSANYVGSWTSATFKVTGDLQNGVEGRTRWVPLRWFTFAPKAGATKRVGASASFDGSHESLIDIWDPKDESQAIMTRGWERYPDAGIWFRWAIDDRGAPIGINPLKPESKLFD